MFKSSVNSFYNILHTPATSSYTLPFSFSQDMPSCSYIPIHLITPFPTLLPNAKPPLHPPPAHSILPNIVSRILHILPALGLGLLQPLQPILFPLLHLLSLLQPLLLVDLARLLHVHFVDFDKTTARFEGVAEEVFAIGE
jgi:hypothetical protein